VIYLLLVFQFGLIMEMRRRLKGFNPPEAASWFLWASQIVYLNGDFFFNANHKTAPWATYSYLYHPERLVIYYTCAIVMFSLSTIGLKRLNTSIGELRQSMLAIMQRVVVFQPLLAGVILTCIAIQMAVLRWDIVMNNSTYLLLGSYDATKVGKSLGSLVQSAVGYSAIVSAMFLAVSVSRRFSAFTFVWIIAFTWQLTIAVAGCSRSGAMIVGIFIIFSSLFAQKRQLVRQMLLALCAGWLYCSALGGRGLGEFGLTALPSILASPIHLEGGQWINMLSSIFQGAFITGDGLDYTADFNPIYKMLSFSPLPSAIDNFSFYLSLYEIRLHAFVPMGAQTEVIFFGPAYTALFWGTLFFLCRHLIQNKPHLGIFYYFSTAFFLVTFMVTGAYPTRNVYRTFILLVILGVILARRARKTAAAHTAVPSPQALRKAP
jgi:hypothetical protein